MLRPGSSGVLTKRPPARSHLLSLWSAARSLRWCSQLRVGTWAPLTPHQRAPALTDPCPLQHRACDPRSNPTLASMSPSATIALGGTTACCSQHVPTTQFQDDAAQADVGCIQGPAAPPPTCPWTEPFLNSWTNCPSESPGSTGACSGFPPGQEEPRPGAQVLLLPPDLTGLLWALSMESHLVVRGALCPGSSHAPRMTCGDSEQLGTMQPPSSPQGYKHWHLSGASSPLSDSKACRYRRVTPVSHAVGGGKWPAVGLGQAGAAAPLDPGARSMRPACFLHSVAAVCPPALLVVPVYLSQPAPAHGGAQEHLRNKPRNERMKRGEAGRRSEGWTQLGLLDTPTFWDPSSSFVIQRSSGHP